MATGRIWAGLFVLVLACGPCVGEMHVAVRLARNATVCATVQLLRAKIDDGNAQLDTWFEIHTDLLSDLHSSWDLWRRLPDGRTTRTVSEEWSRDDDGHAEVIRTTISFDIGKDAVEIWKRTTLITTPFRFEPIRLYQGLPPPFDAMDGQEDDELDDTLLCYTPIWNIQCPVDSAWCIRLCTLNICAVTALEVLATCVCTMVGFVAVVFTLFLLTDLCLVYSYTLPFLV